jgi:predicted component of type VI protein secretion system
MKGKTEESVPSAAPVAQSQSTLNELVRVLQGRKLKYTVRLLLKSGQELEFQTENKLGLDWNNVIRAVVLEPATYNEKNNVIVPWAEVLVLRQEANEE